jgi:hypothetical protein
MFIFFQSRSITEPLSTSRGTLGFRGTPAEKPCFRLKYVVTLLLYWMGCSPSQTPNNLEDWWVAS